MTRFVIFAKYISIIYIGINANFITKLPNITWIPKKIAKNAIYKYYITWKLTYYVESTSFLSYVFENNFFNTFYTISFSTFTIIVFLDIFHILKQKLTSLSYKKVFIISILKY